MIKDNQIRITITTELKNDYLKVCNDKGTNFSDDLRRYITSEVKQYNETNSAASNRNAK